MGTGAFPLPTDHTGRQSAGPEIRCQEESKARRSHSYPDGPTGPLPRSSVVHPGCTVGIIYRIRFVFAILAEIAVTSRMIWDDFECSGRLTATEAGA